MIAKHLLRLHIKAPATLRLTTLSVRNFSLPGQAYHCYDPFSTFYSNDLVEHFAQLNTAERVGDVVLEDKINEDLNFGEPLIGEEKTL